MRPFSLRLGALVLALRLGRILTAPVVLVAQV